MARTGITFDQVAHQADAMAAEGRNPTIQGLREALGGTGSPNTIHKHLTAWRAARPQAAAQAAELPAELVAALSRELGRAAAEARAEIEGRREAEPSDARARTRPGPRPGYVKLVPFLGLPTPSPWS